MPLLSELTLINCTEDLGDVTVLGINAQVHTTDRTEKNAEYRATPSIARYIMVEQDTVGGMMFAREGDRWAGTLLGADSVIALPEINATLTLAEAYEGLALPPVHTAR